jgi:preprotein translocase subunit SecF
MNIIGKRYIFFLISACVILPGLIIMAIYGVPLSIDFTGGSLLEVQIKGPVVQPAQVIKVYDSLGFTDVEVQSSVNQTMIIRSKYLDENQRTELIDAIQKNLNVTLDVLQFDSVGPTIGQEVTQRGALAVVLAALGVILYITFAFRGVKHALHYSISAIVAEIHDILVLTSVAAIGSHFFGWQIDSLFLSAFLTVIGFSVQDTIVIFDRMRENANIFRKVPFETLINHSIVQTLQRSINTQLMASQFLMLSMALFGGITLKAFSILLLIGLFSGAYSSICIAAPVLVIWENKEWRTWFRRGKVSEA